MTYSLIATSPAGEESVSMISESAEATVESKHHKIRYFGAEGWAYDIRKTTEAHRAEMAALPRAWR